MYSELKMDIALRHGVKKWPELPDGVFAFQSGHFIEVAVPEPVIFIVDNTTEYPPADYASRFMTVFSDKFVNALRKSGVSNIQSYKAKLVNPKTDESWDNYQVINLLEKVSCADLEKSLYRKLLGNYEFSKLVVDEQKAKGALFFRLTESHDKIIVHDDVLDFMYNEDDNPIFSGIDFDIIELSSESSNQ